MTETPKPATLKLQPPQWKTLVLSELQDIGVNLQRVNLMDPQGLKWIDERWNSVRASFMVGWEISSRPFVQEALRQQAEHQVPEIEQPVPIAQPNGVEPEKKAKGWPKGKKRNKPPVSSAAVLPPVTQ